MQSQYNVGPMQFHDIETFDVAAPLLRLASALGLETVVTPYGRSGSVAVQISEPRKAYDAEEVLAFVLAVEQVANPGAVEAILERAQEAAEHLANNAR